jgi:hypothetical protein
MGLAVKALGFISAASRSKFTLELKYLVLPALLQAVKA